MKDNPIYRLSKTQVREYQKILGLHAKRIEQLLRKHRATPGTQLFLQKWLFKIATDISKDTQSLLVESVEQVIEKTLETYNKLHKGEKLSEDKLALLKKEIRKDFLLSEYKKATVDQRLLQAERRIKVNLQRELQNLVSTTEMDSYSTINLINSITGKGVQEGGSASRWNSRLILSEMYRAYQHTGKVVLAELGVESVEWANSPRHENKKSLIDEYAEKVYTPKSLPEYPYPCNDSYFIPIY